MSTQLYVLAGPAVCGNFFSYFKQELILKGVFVVVSDGEYANGGYGPSLYIQRRFNSPEEAEAAICKLAYSHSIEKGKHDAENAKDT